MTMSNTIYALASAHGKAGVAVVRVSGSDVPHLLKKLIGKVPKPRLATYSKIYNQQNNAIDSAITLFFEEPQSFTGEHVAEFHIHGSASIKRLLFDCLEHYGVRPAQAGEFTRRAVQNKKIDLLQAEGLKALIDAETEVQHLHSLQHAEGSFNAHLEGYYEKLKKLVAYTEAHLDFSEEELGDTLLDSISSQAESLLLEIDIMLQHYERSRLIQDGVRIAIVGYPNVGKSSFLNYVAQQDVAIVTDIPGTTRDTISIRANFGGVLVQIMDTAGLRETDDPIEKEGIRRSLRSIEQADYIIILFDNNWQNHFERFSGLCKNKPKLWIVNKSDLPHQPMEKAIHISLNNGYNLDAVMQAIASDMQTIVGDLASPVLNTQRQFDIMQQVNVLLRKGSRERNLEILCEIYRQALTNFSQMYGRTHSDDILDLVFRDFCIGK
jgi:tRNA modification GTPase